MDERPSIGAAEAVGSGLVTLAFITAWAEDTQYKTGRLDFLLPLVTEVIRGYGVASFSVQNVSSSICNHFGITLPGFVVSSLLRICSEYGYVIKAGDKKYCVKTGADIPIKDIEVEAESLRNEQEAFLKELSTHAISKGLCQDEQEVQAAFSDFLLANSPFMFSKRYDGFLTDLGDSWIARYIARFHSNDDTFMSMLVRLMRGALLYNAAFLPDLRSEKTPPSMKGVDVYLDTPVVLEILDFDGPDFKNYDLEAIRQVSAAGAQVCVFRDTVNEVDGILYNSLRGYDDPSAIARYKTLRHIRELGIGKADLVLRKATVETDLEGLGITILDRPPRIKEYVGHEESLYVQLEDSNGVSGTPRVKHDVDCVAAILTLRGTSEPKRLANCRAVFVSSTSSTVKSVGKWWYGHEHRQSLSPMMSLFKVANYAWLSMPHATDGDLQRLSLIATCSAALEPSTQTLEKFSSQVAELSAKGMTDAQVNAILMTAAHSSARLDQEEDVLVGSIGEVDAELVFNEAIEELSREPAQRAADAAREEQKRADNEIIAELRDELRKTVEQQNKIVEMLKEQERCQVESENSRLAHEGRVAWVARWVLYLLLFAGLFLLLVEVLKMAVLPFVQSRLPGIATNFDALSCLVSLIIALLASKGLNEKIRSLSEKLASKIVRG